MGPESRALLSEVTGADLGSNAFPFATMQTITVAGANLRALRISYVGELGWELHVPVDQMLAVYQAITSVGDEHELCHAGYRAIESLRLEKGYRAWGAELTPEHTPLEAGLDFAVQLDGPTDFLGRNALLRQRKMGMGKRLACFSAAPEVILLGRETIYRDGAPVGWLTSGGYGYSVKKSIGYGYVRHAQVDDMNFLQCGCYELEVASERVPCEIHLEPLYDPTMIRVRQ
jgi:4-methylaminobutanoate oxidase (formaldehyde-forming)